MDTLGDETWDVVIAGTGLPQALLALSLSRSGKKVLHADQHDYYGGEDAGLSLQEIKSWAQEVNQGQSSHFSQVIIHEPSSRENSDPSASALASSRSYTLSLNPQIIYTDSRFISDIVASQIYLQLEFLAVGSCFVLEDGSLRKIPSTREDVFADDGLSIRDKRALMKFLRYILQDQEATEMVPIPTETALYPTLSSYFKFSPTLQSPILALSLSSRSGFAVKQGMVANRIRRHMKSMGTFGPGISSVMAKYGGNAEIIQVACRACAVGGGVYLLGQGVAEIKDADASSSGDDNLLAVTLTSGFTVRSHHVVGGKDDLPPSFISYATAGTEERVNTLHYIGIVSDSLQTFFTPASENGSNSAIATVMIDDKTDAHMSPVYLQFHSHELGGCPRGQCIVYGSVRDPDAQSLSRITDALQTLLASQAITEHGSILWSMSYTASADSKDRVSEDLLQTSHPSVFCFRPKEYDIAFNDQIISEVNTVWTRIMGDSATNVSFLRFEQRNINDEEEVE